VESGDAAAPFFLRFFFIEILGASGDVDARRSGSQQSFSASSWTFFLRFFFCSFVLFDIWFPDACRAESMFNAKAGKLLA
jgi:hypothetical protein